MHGLDERSVASMSITDTKTDSITATVRRYVELIGTGSAESLAELFSDDATIEDPVGTEPRVGRAAIHEFFTSLEDLNRSSELLAMRVAGNEAAFHFAITFDTGGVRMRLAPIDTMVFDENGKIAAVRSYFAQSDVEQLSQA